MPLRINLMYTVGQARCNANQTASKTNYRIRFIDLCWFGRTAWLHLCIFERTFWMLGAMGITFENTRGQQKKQMGQLWRTVRIPVLGSEFDDMSCLFQALLLNAFQRWQVMSKSLQNTSNMCSKYAFESAKTEKPMTRVFAFCWMFSHLLVFVGIFSTWWLVFLFCMV